MIENRLWAALQRRESGGGCLQSAARYRRHRGDRPGYYADCAARVAACRAGRSALRPETRFRSACFERKREDLPQRSRQRLFECLLSLLVHLGMRRAYRQAAIARAGLADRTLVRDAEALCNLIAQINPPSGQSTCCAGLGPGSTSAASFGLLLRSEFRRRTRRPARAKPSQVFHIVAMHSVSQGQAIYTAALGQEDSLNQTEIRGQGREVRLDHRVAHGTGPEEYRSTIAASPRG